MALPYYNNNNYPLYNQPQYQSQQQAQMQTAGCMMVPSEDEVQKYVRDDQTNTQINVQNTQKNSPDYAVKADIEKTQKQIDSLNEQIRPLLRNTNNRKPEVKNNEQ